MDFDQISRMAAAACQFKVQDGERSFTMRLPSTHAIEVEALRSRMHADEVDPAQVAVLRRRLLSRAVIAWSGVMWGHLAEGGGPDAADVSADAVALLFDAEPGLEKRLELEFMARLSERNAKRAQAAKN